MPRTVSPRGNASRQRSRPDPPELTTGLLLRAYATGFFPMAEGCGKEIRWYSPDPRTIIPLEAFHLPRSLKRTIAKNVFSIKYDTAFPEIISLCASREDTWISGEIIGLYTALFREGYAHSVESWEGDDLAGGLYGVALGGAFFGESMVSLRTDASKVALAALVNRLQKGGFTLLDTQFQTPHLARFGAVEIPREKYLEKLGRAVRISANF